MKRMAIVLALIWAPGLSFSSNLLINNSFTPNLIIPSKFASSSETAVLEWGCPIADVIQANSTAEAIQKIGQVCMDDVRKAAVKKPGVFEVINVSVVWPDVAVSATHEGNYRLEGTIFLETLIMKGRSENQ